MPQERLPAARPPISDKRRHSELRHLERFSAVGEQLQAEQPEEGESVN
jgi:hypothetical protein